MASWSTRRKYAYFLVFVALVALGVGVPSYFALYKAPTCFDGVENGGERGVDCGGPCARLCSADFSMPRVLWSYSARVVPGVYNALAYIQNPNPSVAARDLPYLFKLYDSQGILIAQRTGSAYIPTGQRFAVFEGGIQAGERVPSITTFEFTGVPEWKQSPLFTALKAVDSSLALSPSPKATVDVRNDSPDKQYSNVDAYIVLYDKDDNRVSFSKTVIDSIGPGETKQVYFTWPEAFPTDIVRTEVLFVNHG